MPGAALIWITAAAAANGAASAPPDIAIHARVQAREVRIEQQGEARLRVWAEPAAGDRVEVKRNLPKGRQRYRNLAIELDAEARIAAAPATADKTPTGE